MNDYTPKEALDLLMEKLRLASPELFARVSEAINAGKDELIEEPVRFGEKPKRKPRLYRKHMAYSDSEALKIALDVLEAHLVETRKFMQAAMSEFEEAEVIEFDRGEESRSSPKEPPPCGHVVLGEGKEKDVVIEVENEAVLQKRDVEDMGSNVRLTGFCSNRTHQQMRHYFEPQRRPYPHLQLTPLDPESENRFVGVLAAELKKMTAA